MTPPTTPETPRPAPAGDVVDRLIRDGATTTVAQTEVAPAALVALRQKLLTVSTADRRKVFAAIETKLREELHAEVRTGLMALRSSVTFTDEVGATVTEMRREIPALTSKNATTAERGRALAWIVAGGAAVAGVFSLVGGNIKRFLAFMALPVVAIMARMRGFDPTEGVGRRPVPIDAALRNPDGSLNFDNRLPTNVNLLGQTLVYREAAGTDVRVSPTAPGSGLRLEYGGRQFGVFMHADRNRTQIEPFENVSHIHRQSDGGLTFILVRARGFAGVTMHMSPESFGGLVSAIKSPGNDVRTTPLSFTVKKSELTGLASMDRVREQLIETGVTPTLSPDGETLSWTGPTFLRPLNAEEVADQTEIRRYPAPAPAPRTGL